MKFLNKIAFFAILFCLACLFVVNAEEDAPGKRPNNILLRRPNPQRSGPLGNKANGGAISPAAASTTTSTTSQPKSQSDDEIDEYEELDGEAGGEKGDEIAPSTTSTTTEPPKKIGPIIRPFRSNDDLLSALKRRQQNSKKGVNHKIEKPIVKASEPEEDENDEPAPQPVQKSTDRNARRNKFTAKKTAPSATNSDSDDGNNEPQQPASPIVKRPGRFSLKNLKSK